MSSTLNSRNIPQNSIEIIEQMQKWITGICGILQDRDSAYQIVCDYYYEFKNKLNNCKKNAKNDQEKICYDRIINELDRGTNTSPLWVDENDSMPHFMRLREAIRVNLIVLKSLKMY